MQNFPSKLNRKVQRVPSNSSNFTHQKLHLLNSSTFSPLKCTVSYTYVGVAITSRELTVSRMVPTHHVYRYCFECKVAIHVHN